MSQTSIRLHTEKQAWENLLGRVDTYDFYHTFDYHQISRNTGESPVLLEYSAGDALILLPLLLRDIPDSDLKDATSVYGYAGPLSNLGESPEESVVATYKVTLEHYLLEMGVVSIFTRMNPFIPGQNELLEGLGTLRPLGDLVNIDLTRDLAASRAAYRRDTKSRVNKARRNFKVKLAESREDVLNFIEVYLMTMEKLDADDSYFFDQEYFFNFLDCDGFQTDILLALDLETDAVAAGSMFVKSNDIIQYHLSGTHPDHMRLAPSRLLIDEMRVRGTEEGFRFFNLGGGYQCKADALFDFKSSFSDQTYPWIIWRYIVNPAEYEKLTQASGVGETQFFPAYRAPKS
ncbi:Acetyltransferase (GNAT) domain-containing protein [Robiginitalea myxolifaciens]|uniref:Acetyltransferase (GNAT) domain-containing protein n=1 Tax=Robiginitalea myxolifaciens TaxID=400055 RepID=A0A1I6H236_9FLAO|nr:GNAT family N-acetyltransferase [Robiginitalea myxolifaciens]SFR48472.1 Acetyltransferase (GNAT) domain-containing protein [Robiginitalea myxolifaciens]